MTFHSISSFANGQPDAYMAAMYRLAPPFRPATLGRQYRHREFSFFAEDTKRVNRRFVVNAGVRYEYFGASVNTGSLKDVEVQLGSGTDFPQRLEGAR